MCVIILKMLAMSAGGDHSAYVLGMLRGVFGRAPALTDWKIVCGVSAGALVGSEICQVDIGNRSAFIKCVNRLMDEHVEFVKPWSKMGTLANVACAFAWHSSLYKDCLVQIVGDHWGEMKRQLFVGCYNQSRGCYESIENPSPSEVAASASVPVVFPSVRINGSDYCDGAVAHVLPMQCLREHLGKVDIDLMLCYPTKHSEYVKANAMTTKYKLVGRIDSSLNENVWTNFNRDLDEIAALVGRDIRVGGLFRVGGTLLRVYVPTEGMYVDFTKRNYSTLRRMHGHGEDVAASVLSIKPEDVS